MTKFSSVTLTVAVCLLFSSLSTRRIGRITSDGSYATSSIAVGAAAEVATSKSTSSNEHRDGMEIERYNDYRATDHKDRQEDDIIIIATVDGTFYGMSKLTGEIMWQQQPEKHQQKQQQDQSTTTNENKHRMRPH
mmetsp:Transcript_11357/g.12617  ORF Transcript_11357/g.12617 Transcript_11357/m.12617 type:complete len:135 (+) Transcript_11357:344-748(+)